MADISTTATKPLILEIKGNSLDDGPGIRSVVFFKGCPLSCTWCHNPESKKSGMEISFDPGQCVGCNTCIETCEEGALARGNPYFINREKCTLCFACTEECPSGAISRVGIEMDVSEVLDTVMRDKPFYDTSGGGITLSGGEPTLSMVFSSQLLSQLWRNGVHTLLETCGHFKMEDFKRLLLPYLNMIYFDIKILDSEKHKKYCGVPNNTILENFQELYQLSKAGDFLLLPRTPLIPGITATDRNLKDIAEFLASIGVSRAALLAYNPLWHDKTGKIGTEDPYTEDKAMTSFMNETSLEKCKAIYRDAGIEVV